MVVRHYKGEPSTYVIQYRGGQVVKHGRGLDIWYLPYNTSIAAVPMISQDAQFIFNEATANYQEVAIQGQLSFRVENPLELAQQLDFTLQPKTGQYRSQDPDKLAQRLINAVQTHTRKGVSQISLEEALITVRELSAEVLAAVQQERDLLALGVVIESLHFTAVTATPEMRKALEADYREGLQRRADRAIYDRRAAALEEERKIRQRELHTDIELEQRRKDLVEMQAANSLKLAEAEAKADELKLSPYGELAPQALVGLALKEWAAHAGTIGNLSITPDLLGQIVGWMGAKQS